MICVLKVIYYCKQMYLRTFQICVLNYVTYPCSFSYCTKISIANSLKKDKSKNRSLTDTNMLLMVEKSIRGEIYHAIINLQ